MYRGMYDSKHRFLGLSRQPSDRVRQYQKGLREKLLCHGCEQLFGRYENYAAQVFYGGANLLLGRKGKHFSIGGTDYKRLKLFFISLLWRFAVTSVDAFTGTELGPHMERLRTMLLTEDPGLCLTYPCLITAITWKANHIGDLMVGPSRGKFEGHHIWQFVVAGFIFTFFVSSHSPPPAVAPGFLQADGSLLIEVREITEIDFLRRIAKDVVKAAQDQQGNRPFRRSVQTIPNAE